MSGKEAELPHEHQDALDAIVRRIVALREKGDEEAAEKALTEAVDSGEITLDEISEACFLMEGEHPIAPSWETCWRAKYDYEKAKAAGLPCEHYLCIL